MDVSVSNSLPVNVVVLQRNLSSVSPSLRESVENVEFTRTELRAYVAAYKKNTSRYICILDASSEPLTDSEDIVRHESQDNPCKIKDKVLKSYGKIVRIT